MIVDRSQSPFGLWNWRSKISSLNFWLPSIVISPSFQRPPSSTGTVMKSRRFCLSLEALGLTGRTSILGSPSTMFL